MTPLEKEILVGILSLRSQLAAIPLHSAEPAARPAILAAKKGLVPTSFAPWVRGSPAGRQRVSRTYRRLADMGLLVRYGFTSKTSQVALTAEGERLARELAGSRGERQKAGTATEAEGPADG